MNRRFVISGISHVINLLNKHPQLLSLSSFQPIREVAEKVKEAVKKSGCSCTAATVYSQNQKVFEHCLYSLSNGDHLLVKSILKIDEICFYTKDATGKFILKCV